MSRHLLVWLGAMAVALSVGCSSDGDGVIESGEAPTLTPLDNRGAMVAGTGIESVSPDRVQIDGDRVAPQTFDVSYRMRDVKSIREAWIQLDIPRAAELVRVGVPLQDSGAVRVEMGSGSPSLGATVQFRASCANGTSSWYAMGTPLVRGRERNAGVVQITNVSPPSIGKTANMDPAKSDAGQRVFVTGKGLSADCTVETRVNGSPVELANARFNGPRYEGLLLFRDLGYSPVAPRFLEMKLVVRRTGAPELAVMKLAFAD